MNKNRLQNNEIGWRIFSIFIVVILLAIAGFLLFSNWRILGKMMSSIKYRQAAEVNLKDVSEREADLTIKLNELKTDTGLDKEIRERFPVAKPGEEVIMIVPGNENETTVDGSTISGGWWNKLINFFK